MKTYKYKPIFIFITLFAIHNICLKSQCSGGFIFLPNGVEVDCSQKNYYLVFHDEFNGNSLDYSKWKTKSNSPPPFDRTLWHDCERELQVYLDSNFIVENGLLKIVAKNNPYNYISTATDTVKCNSSGEILYLPGEEINEYFDFTSGRIEAQDYFAVSPDDNFIMEVRCKVPKGVGLWPAFWMWHFDEIDVFEYFGTKEGCGIGSFKRFQSAYIGSDLIPCSSKHKFSFDLTEEFHTYKVEVTKWYIKWFFDGDLIREAPRLIKFSDLSSTLTCGTTLGPGLFIEDLRFFSFTEERFFRPILNLAIHQNCTMEEVSGLPAQFDIDFVRVYKAIDETDEENLCYYYIEGSDNLCFGQPYNYLVEGNLQVDEIIWETSPNLQIVDQSNNFIKIVSNSESGYGWIKANIKNISYCKDSTLVKEISIINPISGTINQQNQGEQTLYSINFIDGNYASVFLNNSTITNIHNIQGQGYATYIPGESSFYIFVETNGFLRIGVYGETEECGEVYREFIFQSYGLSFNITPNPASNLLTISTSLEESTLEINHSESYTEIVAISPLIKRIRVFDQLSGYSILERTFDSAFNEVILDVSSLLSGFYFVEITRKDTKVEVYSIIKI